MQNGPYHGLPIPIACCLNGEEGLFRTRGGDWYFQQLSITCQNHNFRTIVCGQIPFPSASVLLLFTVHVGLTLYFPLMIGIISN